MPEQGHQGLHRHAGVGQLGGPRVPELVRDDAQRLTVAAGEAGGTDGIA